MAEASVSVRVVCRFRPPLINARAEKLAQASKEKEKEKAVEKTATPDTKASKAKRQTPASPSPNDAFELNYLDDGKSVTLRLPGEAQQSDTGQQKERDNSYPFTFDAVFGPDSTQDQIFKILAKETVDDILKGYNGTIFAYGQTGSGKTHTMFGPKGDPVNGGIIPRSAAYLFKGINDSEEIEEVTIKCSFLEIYRENIRDLLNPKNTQLRVRETPAGEVLVQGLLEEYCAGEEDILKLIELGEKSRSVASTDMNAVSSRSHSVLIVTVTQKLKDGSTRVGKLNLADLAGSERIAQTGATGQTLEEAKKINQSLSALGNCINALTDSTRTHVPFRDSTLTYLLKDSLGGNTKTTLLVNCSAEPINGLETLSTLRFAQRAKKVQNKARVNKKKSVAELTAEVNQLRKELAACRKQLKAVQAVLIKLKEGGIKVPDINLTDVDADEKKEAAANGSGGSGSGGAAAASTAAAAGPSAADLERLERERKDRELREAELKARELKQTEAETAAGLRERERELAEQKRIDEWKRREDDRTKRDAEAAAEHDRVTAQAIHLKSEFAKLEAERKTFDADRKRREIERAAEEVRSQRRKKEDEAKRAEDEKTRKVEEAKREEERKQDELKRAEEEKKRLEDFEKRRKDEQIRFQKQLEDAKSALNQVLTEKEKDSEQAKIADLERRQADEASRLQREEDERTRKAETDHAASVLAAAEQRRLDEAKELARLKADAAEREAEWTRLDGERAKKEAEDEERRRGLEEERDVARATIERLEKEMADARDKQSREAAAANRERSEREQREISAQAERELKERQNAQKVEAERTAERAAVSALTDEKTKLASRTQELQDELAERDEKIEALTQNNSSLQAKVDELTKPRDLASTHQKVQELIAAGTKTGGSDAAAATAARSAETERQLKELTDKNALLEQRIHDMTETWTAYLALVQESQDAFAKERAELMEKAKYAPSGAGGGGAAAAGGYGSTANSNSNAAAANNSRVSKSKIVVPVQPGKKVVTPATQNTGFFGSFFGRATPEDEAAARTREEKARAERIYREQKEKEEKLKREAVAKEEKRLKDEHDKEIAMDPTKGNMARRGWLFKKPVGISFSSSWKKRLFVLRQHSLAYFEMPESGVGRAVLKGSIQLAPYSKVHVQDYSGVKYGFEVVTGPATCRMHSSGATDTIEWVYAIKKVLDNFRVAALAQQQPTTSSVAIPASPNPNGPSSSAPNTPSTPHRGSITGTSPGTAAGGGMQSPIASMASPGTAGGSGGGGGGTPSVALSPASPATVGATGGGGGGGTPMSPNVGESTPDTANKMLTSALSNVRSYASYRAAKLEQQKQAKAEEEARAAAGAPKSPTNASGRASYAATLERLGIKETSAADDSDDTVANGDDLDGIVKKPATAATASNPTITSQTAAANAAAAAHVPQYLVAITSPPPAKSAAGGGTISTPLGTITESNSKRSTPASAAAKQPQNPLDDIL